MSQPSMRWKLQDDVLARGFVCLALWVSGCGHDHAARGDVERTDDEPSNSGGSTASGGDSSLGGDGGLGGLVGAGGQVETPADPRLEQAASFDCTPPEGTIPPLHLTEVASGFKNPMQVTFAPGDPERLYVIEQSGDLRVIEGGVLRDQPALSVRVARGSIEEGLLGIAFHPRHRENGLLYLHYSAHNTHPTAPRGATVIEEYTMTDDPNVVDPESARVVLVDPREELDGADHNGGTIVFGKDQLLYIFLGDGGGPGANDAAQDPSTFPGSILRIDPLEQPGGAAYAPHSENSLGDGAAPEVWVHGVRNPFRGSVDGCTGLVYIGDVGLNHYEEINILSPELGGANLGWPLKEGTLCHDSPCPTDLLDPTYVFETSPSGGAVTGGSVYRGHAISALRGRYFFGDSSSGRVWSMRYDEMSGETEDLVDHTTTLTTPVITSIENGPTGEIYLTSRLEGAVYRIDEGF